MIFGICDDELEETGFVQKTLHENNLLRQEDKVKVYTPDVLSSEIENNKFECDILITDIQFAGFDFDGIYLVKIINEKYPLCEIVFMSNYADFSDKIYEAEHVYFVQKKNVESVMPKAIEKALKACKEESGGKVFGFYSDGVQTYLRVRDILYVERDKRNINIITKDKNYPCIYSLTKLIHMIEDEHLVRANGSVVINIAHVNSVSASEICIDNGKNIETSARFQSKVKTAYIRWVEENG